MLFTIVKKCSNFDDDDDKNIDEIKGQIQIEATQERENDKKAKINVIKKKIKSVSTMSKMFSTLREE